MKEFINRQIGKAAVTLKSGDTVLLGVEHAFNSELNDRKKLVHKPYSSLEPSGLQRYVFRLNKKSKTAGTTTSVKANLPCSAIHRVFHGIEQISDAEFFGTKAPENAVIYKADNKFFREQNADKTKNLCYEMKIIWDKSKKYPVWITIDNFFAPLNKLPGGTVNIVKDQTEAKKSVTMFLSLEQAYELFNHLDKCWDDYRQASFDTNLEHSLLPVVVE